MRESEKNKAISLCTCVAVCESTLEHIKGFLKTVALLACLLDAQESLVAGTQSTTLFGDHPFSIKHPQDNFGLQNVN